MASLRALNRLVQPRTAFKRLYISKNTHGAAPPILARSLSSASFSPLLCLSSLSSSSSSLQHPFLASGSSRRYYTPMTQDEQDAEKKRVASLTPFQKDQELRQYNRDIAKLELLRGINTGEAYTWRGRYKSLARDYGIPLVAWYWGVWCSTAVVCYGAIELGGVDVMALIANIDYKYGWDLSSKVDPEIGKIGLTLVLNELVEPLRLPVVILTVKPVMDRFFPPKF